MSFVYNESDNLNTYFGELISSNIKKTIKNEIGNLKQDIKNDIMGKKTDEVLPVMSVCGIIKCKDGILAFADRKASRRVNEVLFEDKDRGLIQKVFENEKLIVTTCGNNQLDNYYYIENAINEILMNTKNIKDFINEFEKYINLNNNKLYEIMICEKNKTTDIFTLQFQNGRVKTIIRNDALVFGANDIYKTVLMQFFDKIKSYNNGLYYSLSVRDMKEKIRLILDSATILYNEILSYNSVSKEIDFVLYKNDDVEE